MLHSLARNSSLINLFFGLVTLNIERNNYEMTDILLWTVSHRNRALYTVGEYRTIYCIVLLHNITYIIPLSYKLALNFV